MKLSSLLTAGIVTGTIVIGGSGVALAAGGNGDGGPTGAEVSGDAAGRAPATKDDCLDALDRRVELLGKANERIAVAKALTEAHRSTMTSINDSAVAGLTALRSAIEADTDPAALKEHCTAVFTDYRVLALRLPQERLAGAADRIEAVVAGSDARIAKLQTVIDRAAERGKDVTAANAAMDDLKAKVAAADAAVDGLADQVLAYTPADWNANQDLLAPARDTVKGAVADLKAALDAAKTALKSLR